MCDSLGVRHEVKRESCWHTSWENFFSFAGLERGNFGVLIWKYLA